MKTLPEFSEQTDIINGEKFHQKKSTFVKIQHENITKLTLNIEFITTKYEIKLRPTRLII